MTLKHPEYAHGISGEELIKEALEFCDEELDGYDGIEYDDDCEVACQRSNTLIRELVRRLEKSGDADLMRKTLEWIEDYALAFADLEEVAQRAGMALRPSRLENWQAASAAQVQEMSGPVAYVCAADMELLSNNYGGLDLSMSPRPRPDLGMKMALYAAPPLSAPQTSRRQAGRGRIKKPA